MSLPDWIIILEESEYYAIGALKDPARWPTLKMGDELVRSGYIAANMDHLACTITLIKVSALQKQGVAE